jgi:Ca2+-binding EF-hand superfamily protein
VLRRCQIVALVFLGSAVLILFPASTVDCVADTLPAGLPPWFKNLDQDRDGQITLSEWRAGGKQLSEFRKYDRNGDGRLTPAEVLRVVRRPIELKLANGRANYSGALAATDGEHHGKKFAKVFTVQLEAGKAYQFDHLSRAFDAYLYLEDPDGKILDQNDDGGEGTNSRIIHHAVKAGTYRLVATSLGGGRLGAFSLTVRVLGGPGGGVPEGFPPPFKAIDTDQDGQISLREWRQAGKRLDEFRRLDRNGDGRLTPEEVLRVVKKPLELTIANGQANYSGSLEATEDTYQGKKSFKIFTISLDAGKTYLLEQASPVYFAFLYLEDSRGEILDANDSGGRGRAARFVYQAVSTGTYRIIATSQGGFRPGLFTLSVRVLDRFGGLVPKGLPPLFKGLDANRDGQISLQEWQKSGKRLDEFRKHDRNGDGFITADEVRGHEKKVPHLEFVQGQATYNGALDEATGETYRGKQTFKIFTVKLESGRTYQIELVSPVYFAYLYLEDANGEILDRNNSGGRGRAARIVHQAADTATYRIVVTSQDGYKPGAFSLSVRVLNRFGGIVSEGLPPPFKELDTDRDGQISLHEWRQAGKRIAEFRQYDRNGDGRLTPEEVLRVVKKPLELKIANGQAIYSGAIAAGDERYGGRKLAKIFTVELEAGKTYRFDHISRAFDAFLYLESPDGEILAQDDDGGGGTNSRIVHHALRSGTYRLVATSLGGGGLGAFSLAVHVLHRHGGSLPEGLPPPLKALDTDQDGQVSLREWRQAGKGLDEFRNQDLNGDGFITAEEVRRTGKKGMHPKGLPPWFRALDADQDGQVSLREWRQAGKHLGEFRQYDRNGDGFITAEEVRRYLQSRLPKNR